jgi:hypothetical protein
VATVSPPGGIWGWPAYKDRDRTRAIERWGIPQDVDAEPSIDITHTLELETWTLSISCSTLSLWDPSCFKLNPVAHAFLSFFFLLYNAWSFEYFLFLFMNSIIYIEIWHLIINLHFHPNMETKALKKILSPGYYYTWVFVRMNSASGNLKKFWSKEREMKFKTRNTAHL